MLMFFPGRSTPRPPHSSLYHMQPLPAPHLSSYIEVKPPSLPAYHFSLSLSLSVYLSPVNRQGGVVFPILVSLTSPKPLPPMTPALQIISKGCGDQSWSFFQNGQEWWGGGVGI